MRRPLRILFSPFGSEGDVNPLLRLAALMAARGHRPEFLLTPHYGRLAEAHGFAWHPMGTQDDFERMAKNPDLWKPGIGTWEVARAMHASLPAYAEAFEAAGGEFDLAVVSSFGLAASALAEARGIPRLMLHLQPMVLRSHGDMPVPVAGGGWFCRAPAAVQDALFFCVDAVLNRTFLPPLNRFRAGLGLPPFRYFYRDALMRAEAVALLFPDWFAPPQPDWPAGIRAFDFPLADGPPAPLPPALAAWLDSGGPPVLWTHGSANVHLAASHALARTVAADVGGRHLLVGRSAPEFPLPDGMLHFPHVAFEDVFPRCRAVVHHGGIGTTSKAFAAGIPQVVIPLAHDQHDNAARVQRLGAGITSRHRARDVARELRTVLSSSAIADTVARCHGLASESPSRFAPLADWAESLAAGGCRGS
jgi:UDP:flavonoid glycosyltransferase YjiC (YdhE family)